MKCNHKMISISRFLMLGILFFLPQPVLHAQEAQPAFNPGERLIFELRWGNITAGEAVLEVLPLEKRNGVDAYHFVLTARTTKFLDKIFKVRDRIDAWTDLEMNHSLYFKQKQREGGYRKEATIEFDWANNQAHYDRKGKKRKSIPLEPGSFDPLSAFYFTRTQSMEGKKRLERHITDGKKNVLGICHIRKREIIEVNDRKYDTFLVEPDLKDVGGVFKKSKDARIQVWVTADERRIPIRLKSKVLVGSFIGELVAMENVLWTPETPVASGGR